MNVVAARPPNFDAILAVFPGAAEPGVMFAWGDTIFFPQGGYIPPQLIAHEEVHQSQQNGIGPEVWWDKYLSWPQFRFGQELAAHIVEYHEFVKFTRSRGMRRNYLDAVAKRLSSPLYGSMATYAEAMAHITRGEAV